ncbi:uncharacterized protein LOC111336105 [Stylophora pistillata]|uniref:uncharacterized protein LOC111336105 n=1 Tax=Stylophora pistillata TaxID=50429 RepID=UPI000C054711|nr:uncharacterized protein LOC111336105 [Stylophora pistillata]
MGAETDLHRLVDLALRSPDAGVVNFNHLHSLLHAILNHIGLSYDPQNGVLNTQLAAAHVEGKDKSTSFEQLNGPGKKISDADNSNRDDNRRDQTTSQLDQRSNFDSLQMRQQNLENKVQELEDRLKILDNLPSTQFIIEQAQKDLGVTQENVSNQNVLSGMWQFMKFNRRLQATEEGIDRVMTILNEFLGSDGKGIAGVKGEVEDIASELRNLKERFLGQKPLQDDNLGENLSEGKSDDTKNSQLLQQQLHSLEKQLKDKFVAKDDLSVYVKWPALEEALNVRKSDFEKKSKEDGGVLDKEQGFVLGKEQGSVLEKAFDHFESENKASDTESDGRPQSAPVPSTQQTPVQTPEVPKTAFTRSTQVNIQEMPLVADHPSQEMVECLRQIGELSDKHNVVEKKIMNVMEAQEEIAGELAKVEETLPQKISKEDLHIPDDLQDQLALLKQGLEFLNTNQDLVALAEIKKMAQDNKEHIEALKRELAILARQSKQQPAFTGVVSQSPAVDSSVLDAIREHLNELQTQQEKLAIATDRQTSEVVGDLSRKQEHIEALYNYVEKLQESKADKENVAMEMDIKADKASLDSKVNISTFDNTFSMLDEGLREALQKMDDYMNEEMALKQALKQLSVDMSEKMDGQAFQALKNYLERRIADVQKSRNMIAAEAKVDFSDAAGFRRPIKFNCISCSRPVELPLRGPLQANLPAPRGVRTKRSKGPYLSYEMDQVRIAVSS